MNDPLVWIALLASMVVSLWLCVRLKRLQLKTLERLSSGESGGFRVLSDREGTLRPHLMRGITWLISGLLLMAYLYSLNSVMAHHWSAPRHWPGTKCRLSALTLDHHPDGHELEQQIQELRRQRAPEENLVRLEQELRELRRFPSAVPLVALILIGIGIAHLGVYFAGKRRLGGQ